MKTTIPTFTNFCPHCNKNMTFSVLTNDRGDEIGKFCIICEWWILLR